MASPISIVNLNGREELLSGDFLRLQKLSSAQVQDLIRDSGRAFGWSTSAPYMDTGPTASTGDGVTGLMLQPDFVGGAGDFKVAVGAGQLLYMNNPGLDPYNEDSEYYVVRWAATQLDWQAAPPNPAQDRIDIVYLPAPTRVLTDVQARNVLVDPVARTINSVNVPKTDRPENVPVYMVGTPGTPPDASLTYAALPAGAIPLFEVYIVAAAADAATFSPCRCVFPRTFEPMSSSHGVLKGCEVLCVAVADETASAAVTLNFNEMHRVVIDGEIITFGGGNDVSFTNGLFQADTIGANNPFTVAPAAPFDVTDRPYYFYVVGGRHRTESSMGLSNYNGGGPVNRWNPVVIIESLIPPDKDGRPSANIGTPYGTTRAGAVYIGVGFTVTNTNFRKSLRFDGDWVYASAGVSATVGFMEADTTTGAGDVNIALAGRPSQSDMADMYFHTVDAAGDDGEVYLGTVAATATPNGVLGSWLYPAVTLTYPVMRRVPLVGVVGTNPDFIIRFTAGGGIFRAIPMGYNMKVNRLGR